MNAHVPQEIIAGLSDAETRIGSGIYKIIVKSPDSYDGKSVVPFEPNAAQMRFLKNLHHRNVVLKARQLGYSTLIAIVYLDHALFNENQRCAIVAQDIDTAAAIFRDKIKFAYDNLPPAFKAAMPLKRESADELLFEHNNSSIRVATSARGGTTNCLHVSEFGKICRKYPEKASEVMRGSIPSVPIDGFTVIESTAEGQGGYFHDIVKMAQATQETGKPLTPRDWRLHFSAWHENPEYILDPTNVIITAKDHEYFDKIETSCDTKLSLHQRAWYVATRKNDFGDQPEAMWQEYPSTLEEPFQTSTEGVYYAVQLAAARHAGRIADIPIVTSVPVNTFWDIGSRDGTAIWFHQKIGAEHRFIDFIEAWDEPYEYFVKAMQAKGYVWGRHFLPHDAEHRRQQGQRNMSPREMLEQLAPGWRFEIVPRIDEIQQGIQLVRSKFSQAYFDQTRCAAGLTHLQMYRREWNERLGVWRDTPMHDEHSEGADSFRMWAQGWEEHTTSSGSVPRRRNGSGWAV